jgi:hypothetical protein
MGGKDCTTGVGAGVEMAEGITGFIAGLTLWASIGVTEGFLSTSCAILLNSSDSACFEK